MTHNFSRLADAWLHASTIDRAAFFAWLVCWVPQTYPPPNEVSDAIDVVRAEVLARRYQAALARHLGLRPPDDA